MGRIKLKKFITFFMLILTVSIYAQIESNNQNNTTKEGSVEKLKAEIKDYINHHLLDSHDFNLFSYTTDAGEHKYIGFPLPVILIDNGLVFFSSSKLKHGKSIVEVKGNYYKLYHSKIIKTDANGTINYNKDQQLINQKPLDLSITKNVVFIIIVGLFMLLIFWRMSKSYEKNKAPKGISKFLEPIILYIRDDIAIPNIGKKHYEKYMSYLLTIFFFIWIINLLGLTPLGVNVTNNIAVAFALALLTYLITFFSGTKGYWKHIFWMPGVPTPMKIILAPIELLGTIIKPFSLMIRLYANITAGHIILMSIIGLMFVFKNWIGSSLSFGMLFALALLELLVATLQAYIFTMLSALYFGMAVEEHDEHH
mgnify:FL=1